MSIPFLSSMIISMIKIQILHMSMKFNCLYLTVIMINVLADYGCFIIWKESYEHEVFNYANNVKDEEIRYTYNSLNQLTKSEKTDNLTYKTTTSSYKYDSVGNRTYNTSSLLLCQTHHKYNLSQYSLNPYLRNSHNL